MRVRRSFFTLQNKNAQIRVWIWAAPPELAQRIRRLSFPNTGGTGVSTRTLSARLTHSARFRREVHWPDRLRAMGFLSGRSRRSENSALFYPALTLVAMHALRETLSPAR
jgi:hypothetical protein